MAENVKCKSCKRLKKHWCKAVLDSPDEDMLRDCCHFLQKTNADRIRAMSDEELAKFIPDWSYTGACKCDEQSYVECNNECEKCVLEWLQQPAEVEE